jgi:hypothetical protein
MQYALGYVRRWALWGALGGSVLACSSDAPPLPSTPSAGNGTGGAQAGAATTVGGSSQAGSGGSTAGAPSGSTGSDAGTGSSGSNAGQAGAGGANTAGTSNGGANTAGATSGGSSAGGAGNGICPAHAQLCLDFEDGAHAGWTKSGNTLVVDETQHSHGRKALHISVAVNSSGGMLVNQGAPLFPLPQKQLWGRMMVYFDGVPDGHTDMANAKGQGPANYNVGEQHDSIMLNYYAGSSATDCWARPKPEKKVPDKTWMCWEWRFDSANNEIDFWMDGTLLRSVKGTGDGCLQGNATWQAPAAFESLSIGERVAERSTTTAYQAWIDDVAISNSARVGCPPLP